MIENNRNNVGPVWRESASLIICAQNPKNTDGYDYEILMLKRSSRTAFVLNQCVFPGGIFDPFDESVEWLKYFQEFGVKQQLLRDLVLVDAKIERPTILEPQGTGCYDRFFKSSKIWAREVSLRINAIRETFEEVGILLCRGRNQLNFQSIECHYLKYFNKSKWQKAVHDDPGNFLRMCRELNVVPDLWGLHEWSCWASPAVVRKGHETAFYITFLNEKPNVLCEESEVAEHFWLPPTALLRMMKNMTIYFMPPQFYEISRLIPYKSFEFLMNFAKKRGGNGVKLHLPILYMCTDGAVSVYPGDDYYTGSPRHATELRNLDVSVVEFRLGSNHIHRIENFGDPNGVIYLNFEPLDGQLKPFCGQDKKHKL